MNGSTSACNDNAAARYSARNGKAPEIELLIRALERVGPLMVEDRAAVENCPMTVRQLEPHRDLIRQGDRPDACHLLLEGFVCCYKMLENGGRQIMAFHLPGDMLDLPSVLLGSVDHSMSTLIKTKLGAIPRATIVDWTETSPDLSRRLWWGALVEAAIGREWVVNVGRRSAYERIAHLFCELVTRLHVAGLADDQPCCLPLTQADLADATGLSAIHVNRVVQQLRRDGLIDMRRQMFVARDWEGLKEAAGFDPAYLHQFMQETADKHRGQRRAAAHSHSLRPIKDSLPV